MARVTYVTKAQQRYATVPVIDEVTGKPKRVPVISKRTGQQKVSKRGPVFMTVTVQDKTKPLPLYNCGFCGKPIEVGTPYKHISPKSGPYGGHQLNRHQDCPTWHVWDYSSSLSARTAQIAYDFEQEIANVESPEDVTSALSSAAEAAREIASEKQDGADNIESGFGHATSMSEELADIAQQLEDWADEIENVEVPDLPDPEEQDCEECAGTGTISSGVDEEDCSECGGSGLVTPDEPSDEQLDEWREQVQDAVSVVDECPV